jgi:hypothetical protein
MKKIFLATLVTMAMMIALATCDSDPETTTPPPPTPPPPSTPTYYTVTFSKNTTDAESTDPSPMIRMTIGISAPNNTVTLPTTPPTRPNYIFQNYNTKADGSGTEFTASTEVADNMTVFAQWVQGYTVTFRGNGATIEADPSFKNVIPPATNVGTLPAPPERPAFRFVKWALTATGQGEFTATTPVNADTGSFEVFAWWEFIGGTPEKVGSTLVHNQPIVVISESGHGVFNGTVNADGSITIKGGAFQYAFPTGADFSVSDYDYFMISYTLSGAATDSATGTLLKQFNSATNYGGIGNASPWWSNQGSGANDIPNVKFPISGAGGSGGIAFQYNGGADGPGYTVKINSVIFTALPRYTVSFDLNGGDGTTPDAIPGVVEGTTLGARMPPNPVKTAAGGPWFFLGWYDGNDLVVASTPIMKTVTLVAKWANVEPAKVELVSASASGVPVYRFNLTGTDTWADIKTITFKIRVDDANSYANTGGRMHVMGNYNEAAFSASGAYTVSSNWNYLRLVYYANNVSVAAILNQTPGDPKNNNAGLNNPSTSLLGQWIEYEMDVSEDSTVRDAAYQSTAAGGYPAATASGPFYFGAGLSSSGSAVTYYIKDVALVKENGAKIANDPLTETVSGTPLGSFYFSSSANTVTRAVVYEPTND